jgi:large subunit ribosomal protein L21
MAYAVVSIGGKQYRVREGQRLLVDRLADEEGKTFNPSILLLGGDGNTDIAPTGVTVTARVVAHVKGEKLRIGKYKPKKGYKRHTGFRAALSQIEIESIGTQSRAAKRKAAPAEPAKAETRAEPEERAAALPEGYAGMTVTQISAAAREWPRPALEAALEYEREHAARKGAIAALESALAANDEEEEHQ